jgi:hypothetical protein
MSKKLIEITNDVAQKTFQCERVVDGETKKVEIDLPVQAIIDSGVSAAISRSLYLLMEQEPKDEVSIAIGPFTWGVTAKKVGESLSFNPTFSLTNEKKLLTEFGEYEEKLHKNISVVESISKSIDSDLFIDTVIHCCKLEEYDTTNQEWIEKKTDADKGVELDQQSARLFVAIHIASILHILSNIKSSDEQMKYDVPGEGVYTIEQKKDKWDIGFLPSKEFKQAIKNDRLVEAMA